MSSSTVLVINSGSSSIKYQLVDPDNRRRDRQGHRSSASATPTGLIKHEHGDAVTEERAPGSRPRPSACVRSCASSTTEGPSLAEAHILAVGHRVVQGGRYFDGPALITDEVRNLIEELCPLAPLHNPAHLKGIDVARELMPDVPHVAVFDTAFFQQLPDKAALYALETGDRREVLGAPLRRPRHLPPVRLPGNLEDCWAATTSSRSSCTWATARPPRPSRTASRSTPPWA